MLGVAGFVPTTPSPPDLLPRRHFPRDSNALRRPWTSLAKAKKGPCGLGRGARLGSTVDFGFNVGLETCLEDSSVSIGTGSWPQGSGKFLVY
jgi:hypothetical protein